MFSFLCLNHELGGTYPTLIIYHSISKNILPSSLLLKQILEVRGGLRRGVLIEFLPAFPRLMSQLRHNQVSNPLMQMLSFA